MTKPVWSHVLALSALPTIPDCIRYIIGVFCYNFNPFSPSVLYKGRQL